MLKRIKRIPHYKWLYYAILFTVIRYLFALFPSICESLYSRGIFLIIRLVIDNTLGWLPFATIYWLVAFLIIWLVLSLGNMLWIWRLYNWKQRLSYFVWGIVGFLCRVWVLFLVLWGFNYARIPLEEQIQLEVAPLSTEQVLKEAQWVQERAIETRNMIKYADTSALTEDHYRGYDLEDKMRAYLADALNEWGFPTWGAVRCRELIPNGVLLRLNVTGIYWPWVGESYVDNALHASRKPFVIAHEMGHGFGFGDESVCNFLGYVACMKATEPEIRYSGYLMYWRYLMGELYSMDKAAYDTLRAKVSIGINNDIKAIRAINDKYPPFMAEFQDAAYNVYLKAQGVKEGLMSYERMVLLVTAWYKAEIFYER